MLLLDHASSTRAPRRLSRRRMLQLAASSAIGLTALAACQRVEPATELNISTPDPNPTPTPYVEPLAEPTAVVSPTATAEPNPVQPEVGLKGRPMYQMDPQHSGRSPHAGPREGVLRRTFETANFQVRNPGGSGADIQSSAAIGADGTIYLANHMGVLFALRDPRRSAGATVTREREALQLAWRFNPPEASSWHSTPALGADGTVYLGFSRGGNTASADGTLYAVRGPETGIEGQVAWAVTLGPGRQTSSPTIGPDGTIYVVSGSGWLFAISPSGEVQWAVQTGPALKSAPALSADGSLIYVASMNGKLYAVAPPASAGVRQATVKWTFTFADYAGRTPLVTAVPGTPGPAGSDGIGSGASPTLGPDGTVYIGANNSNFYAVTPDGQLRWLFEAEREIAGIWSTAALSADASTLYFGANRGGIYAVNAEDGSLQWKYAITSSVYSSPALDATGILYTGCTAGHVIALDTASGSAVFDFDAQAPVWTAPAIRPDGALVVADRNGKVLVLG